MKRPSERLLRAMRSACVLLALGSAGHAVAADLPAQIHYEVFDGDKRVGQLDITLTPSAQGLVVHQRGEIVLHRMMLKATVHQTIDERWQGKRLMALDSETTAEATIGSSHKRLSVVRDDAGTLRATGDKKTQDLSADALPLTLWSARTLVAGPHFGLAEAEPVEVRAHAATDDGSTVRWQDETCVRRDLEAISGAKTSIVAAWIGGDGVVCKLRMSAGSDVFTYVRQPPP